MKTNSHISLIVLGLILYIFMPLNSNAQINWEKDTNNPIMQVQPGTWYAWNIMWPVVIHEDDTLKMWFIGNNSSPGRHIGYAESTDGFEWEILDDPVISGGEPGTWAFNIYLGSVLRINGTLHMWFCGTDYNNENSRIGYAWSDEEHTWNIHPEPVLEPGELGAWDDVWTMFPSVYYDGTKYHMYYSGGGDNFEMGYATSSDGINWEKDYENSPIIKLGPSGSFYDTGVVGAHTFKHNGTLHMYFTGWDGTSWSPPYNSYWRIGYASSEDYVNWNVYQDPVLDVGGPGSWDETVVGGASVLIHDDYYKMWYYGEHYNSFIEIGYALGDIEPVLYPPPQNLAIQITGSDVTLSWEAPAAEEVLGYNVYRDGLIIAEDITELSYTDPDLPDGSYWYAVTALYPEGESILCEPVQATIGGFIGKLQGFVRDAQTNLNIESAWVSALNADFGAVTYTTPFGSHYTLSLPGGTYDVTCQASGYQSQTLEDFQIVDGETKHHTYYLNPSNSFFTEPDREENQVSTGIYPNPFQTSTTITYSLIDDSYVWLKIQKAYGQELITLVDEFQEKGFYQVVLDGSELEPGIYFCVLKTNEGKRIMKMIKL